jgi:GT2 family glycosyltransferase
MTNEGEVRITVGVKALNEAAHIHSSLSSALEAVRPFGGEVILADSGSSDGTLEIAGSLPVRIVQLQNPEERSCGAGAQLAFQHARGRYFHLLDGDMVLNVDFIEQGMRFLDAHSEFAGVGGHVEEVNTMSEEFQIRAAQLAEQRQDYPRLVDRLDCGGLYRTSAIREVGYFADRNLHAFEEYELAARLQQRGYKLARIDVPMVEHYGHTASGYRLLWRRLRSGYTGGVGEVLRAAVQGAHLGIVMRQLTHVRTALFVMSWWMALIASLFLSVWVALVLLVFPVLFLAWRRGSFWLGVYSFVSWNFNAVGLLIGFIRPRASPTKPLASLDLTDAQRHRS